MQVTNYMEEDPSVASGEDNIFLIMQPLRDVNPLRYDFTDILSLPEGSNALISLPDTVGFSGEVSLGISSQLKGSPGQTYFSLVLPNDGRNYPLVDTLASLNRKERLEMLYGQSKASEFAKNTNSFDDKLRLTNLEYKDLFSMVQTIQSAFVSTAKDFQLEKTNAEVAVALSEEKPLQTFAAASPNYSLFLSGP